MNDEVTTDQERRSGPLKVGTDELAHGARLRGGLAALVGIVLATAYLATDQHDLPPIARRAPAMAIPDWHTTEPVNAIVYGTRAFDTVGETFVLVAAVVSVTTLARRRRPRPDAAAEDLIATRERSRQPADHQGDPTARRAEQAEESGSEELNEPTGRRPALDPEAGMGDVVRVATRVLLPILFVAGVLIYAWGYSPGGGFPAGTVVAGVALLVYASHGLNGLRRFGSTSLLETIEIVASSAVLMLAAAGLIFAGSVTANVLPLGRVHTIVGGGNIQLLSGIELVEVAAGLLLVILAILGMHHDWTDEIGTHDDGTDGR